MQQKLVLAWVDNTGLELTGRYRDRYSHHPETRAAPEARAACWGDDTPELLARLKDHVEAEKSDHLWMGYFVLASDDNLLSSARALALEAAKQPA